MSDQIPTPEYSTHDQPFPPVNTSHQGPKPQRVLACRSCQQRKVKCNRKFPCSNCTKAGIECLSASSLPRQRRRRFPERVLLDRLQHYEQLLSQHHIPFEPLHSIAKGNELCPDRASNQSPRVMEDTGESSSQNLDTTSPAANSPTKNFWHAMNHKVSLNHNVNIEIGDEQDAEEDESDDSSYLLREHDVKTAWDSLYDSNDNLLFSAPDPSVDLASLHPSHIHTFQLWQTYLENIDPLIKVTHTPTLQPRIISAASRLNDIDPNLEALMFSIYSVAVISTTHADCEKQFGTPRNELLRSYQLATREALLRCGFLKTNNRDCLTALHFYLISIKPTTDPRALSSILGTTTRIAQRMGIHDETMNSKNSTLEAELRRRLWWSLVLFDARISEMTEFRTGLLVPTWTCKPPTNTNDFDLRSGSKGLPNSTSPTSEALFAVIRGEMGEYLRFSDFHLDFINPTLKAIARRGAPSSASNVDELGALEALIEEKYLRHCDPGNPLQYMTTWWARGQIARTRLMHNLSQYADSTAFSRDTQRDAGLSYALQMLECDTKAMSSKLTQGFRWLLYLNFPFPAYVFIVQELRKRPLGDHVAPAWDAMSQNCTVRFMDLESKNSPFPIEKYTNPFFKIFAGVVMAAWVARETALADSGVIENPPSIITQIKARVSQYDPRPTGNATDGQDTSGDGASNTNPGMSELADPHLGYNFGSDPSIQMGSNLHPFGLTNMEATMAAGLNQWGWPVPNWGSYSW